MPASSPIVWTDVDLVAEARSLLAGEEVAIDARPEGTLDGIESADAVIAGSRIRCDAALFSRCPRLRIVARTGIGYDRVDVAAATAAGILATHTPDAPTESTAEFTIALMLAVARRIASGATPLAAGRWVQGEPVIGTDLAGKVLGLVGCGRIGRRVAEIALAFRMDVQAYDPIAASLPPGVRRAGSLAGLLGSSDVVSLHAPSTPATRHLLSHEALARLRPGALLVNAARGPLVDESALLAALESGRVGGAGLDVWDPEPPPADNPLLRHPRVVATPHMAASTREGRRRSHLAAAGQVIRALRGEEPPDLLNPGARPRASGR